MQIRKIYIDGYNALRKVRRFEKLMKSDADAARRGFVERIRGKLAIGTQAVVVFDGAGEHVLGSGPVSVVFTYTRTADSWIRNALEQEKHASSILVVSSDHEIQNHARACGALVQRAENFVDESAIDADAAITEKPLDQPLSDSEVEQWMKLFANPKRD